MMMDFMKRVGVLKCMWLGTFLSLSIFSLPVIAEADLSLLNAVKSQDWVTSHSLLNEKDTAINATQPDGTTALAWAVYWDNKEIVEHLLNVGADPNIGNDYNVTPLILSAENRNVEIMAILLEGGGDPNAATWSGETLLMTSARTGLIDAAKMLLDYGADINHVDQRRGQSALMWAISFGNSDIARLLIGRGADVNAATIRLNENFQPLELEGYGGATVKAVPMGGYTPLLFAARVGNFDMAQLLIEHGADVNATSNTDGSPLLMASAQGFEDLALYLLEQGADPNVVDTNGLTPLHYALRDGIKVLHGLAVGDKEMVCNFGGESFLCRPHETLNEDQLAYLADPESEVYIVKAEVDGYGYYDANKPLAGPNMHVLASALLARGADPNAKMKYPPEVLRLERNPWFTMKNATPFFLASAAQDVEAIAMLMEMGADPIIKTEIDQGLYDAEVNHPAEDNMVVGDATSLMAAIGMGRRADLTIEQEENAIQIAERLIALGADVNETSITGWAPLHAAAFYGSDRLVRFLVEKGAKVDAMTGCGRTPISLALANTTEGMLDRHLPRVETAELLLELGAGEYPPSSPVGQCVGGRGGLEPTVINIMGRQSDWVKESIQAVVDKLEEKKQSWESETAL